MGRRRGEEAKGATDEKSVDRGVYQARCGDGDGARAECYIHTYVYMYIHVYTCVYTYRPRRVEGGVLLEVEPSSEGGGGRRGWGRREGNGRVRGGVGVWAGVGWEREGERARGV